MKDSSLHRFSWCAFRSNLLSLKPTEAPALEVASSFLLRRDDPFKYNILFAEESFSAEMTSKVAAVAPDWMKFQTDRDNVLRQEQHGNETSTADVKPVSIQSLYDEFFKNSATLTDAYTALDRACYWEAGIYRIRISVEGARPDKVFIKEYEFALSEGDAESLRLNTISILRALCGFQEVFRFAYPQYQTK